MQDEISRLVAELRKEAGWENERDAFGHAEAIAKLGGVDALIGVLVSMAAVDLSDDAGDVSDECWRASSAAVHGLVLLGTRSVPPLLAIVTGPPSRARGYAARALGRIRDPQALPALLALATDEHDRASALEALGALTQPHLR